MTTPRKAGRPKLQEGKKRKPLNLTMDPELVAQADAYWRKNGFSSLSAFVAHSLKELMKLDVGPNFSSRFEQFPEGPSNIVELRYFGSVAAGVPGGPVDVSDSTMPVSGKYDPETHYLLRVNGQSMEPEYRDGSLIICRKLKDGEYAAKNHDVIASDGSGAYFKRLVYSKEGKKGDTPRKATPRLISLNPEYDEVIPLGEAPIVAVVVGKL